MSLSLVIDATLALASAVQFYRASQTVHFPAGAGLSVFDGRVGPHGIHKSRRVIPGSVREFKSLILGNSGARQADFDRIFRRESDGPQAYSAVIQSSGKIDLVSPEGTLLPINASKNIWEDLKMPGRWGTKLALLGGVFLVTDLAVKCLSASHEGILDRLIR